MKNATMPRGYRLVAWKGGWSVETRRVEVEVIAGVEVRHVMHVTRGGKLSRAGDVWKTREGARRAAWKAHTRDRRGVQ